METLTLQNRSFVRERLFLLFMLFEVSLIASLLFLDYKTVSIVALAGILLGIVAWDMRIAVCGMVAFASAVAYGIKSITGPMLVALGVILCSVWLAAYFRSCLGEFKIRKTSLNLPVGVFLFMGCLQATRGFISGYSVKFIYLELLAYLGFSVVFLVPSFFDRRTTKNFFQLLILLAYYQAATGIFHYLEVGHRIGGHLFGTFPSLIALVLLNIALYSTGNLKKLFYLLISAPLVLHLLLSFTRGYWLGFLTAVFVSLAVYVVSSGKTPAKRAFVLLRGVSLFAIGMIAILAAASQFAGDNRLYQKVSTRFLSSFSSEASTQTMTNAARLVEYQACLGQITRDPIWGQGIGYALTIKQPILQSRGTPWFIHQSYLMITLKMGLIGLLSFLWIFYVFFKVGVRASRDIQDGYYRGMAFGFMANAVQLLTIALTNYEFAAVVNTYYLGFAMGAVMILASSNDKNHEKVLP
jgi:O-antigen ligase